MPTGALALTILVLGTSSPRSDQDDTIESGCPSQEMVRQAALQASGDEPDWSSLSWQVLEAQQILRVTVHGSRQHPEVRELELAGETCEQRAEAVAVVWLASALGAPAAPPDAPRFPRGLAPAPTSRPTPPVLSARSSAAEEPTTDPASGSLWWRRLELQGAGLAAWSGHAPAIGGSLGIGLALAEASGVRVSAAYTGAMQTAVDPGQAQWRRAAAAVGWFQRWQRSRWLVDLSPALVWSRLAISGQGFSSNDRGTSTDLGARATLSTGWRGRHITPVIVVEATGWFGQQELTIENLPSRGQVPRWTLALGLGLLWDLSAPPQGG